MARQDIAGLLTGMPQQQRPNPNMSSAEWRLAFGQQQSDNMTRGLQGAVGGLMGTGMAGAASPQEQIQIADLKVQERISKLATSENPDEVRQAAQLLQQRGDSAGAAQLLAQLRAKVQDKYDANQEARSALAAEQRTESFKLGKEDRLKQETKDAAQLKRQTDQQTRAERSLVLQEEAAAREKKRSEAVMTDRDTELEQEASLRTVYETQARAEGREALADAIRDGLSLSSVASILYTKTSTAAITPPKGAEKVAFEKLLDSPKLQEAIPDIFQVGIEWGKTSSDSRDLIFYKTKEIRQREGNRITVEDAMIQALEEVAKVLTPTPETDGIDEETIAEQNASLSTSTVAPDGSTDGYGGVR